MEPRHIVEFTRTGWELNHTLACPGNLLDCPLTEACRDLAGPPRIGRFWAGISRKKPETIILGEECPAVIHGTSRITRWHFSPDKKRPG